MNNILLYVIWIFYFLGNIQVSLSKTSIPNKGCSGGIILTARDGKIVINQTVDEWLAIGKFTQQNIWCPQFIHIHTYLLCIHYNMLLIYGTFISYSIFELISYDHDIIHISIIIHSYRLFLILLWIFLSLLSFHWKYMKKPCLRFVKRCSHNQLNDTYVWRYPSIFNPQASCFNLQECNLKIDIWRASFILSCRTFFWRSWKQL